MESYSITLNLYGAPMMGMKRAIRRYPCFDLDTIASSAQERRFGWGLKKEEGGEIEGYENFLCCIHT